MADTTSSQSAAPYPQRPRPVVIEPHHNNAAPETRQAETNPTIDLATDVATTCMETAQALLEHTSNPVLIQELKQLLIDLRVTVEEVDRAGKLSSLEVEHLVDSIHSMRIHLNETHRYVLFKERLSKLYEGEHGKTVIGHVAKKASELDEKYERTNAYRMYHLLTDDTHHNDRYLYPPPYYYEHHDFPEEDAVIHFIEMLEDKYGTKHDVHATKNDGDVNDSFE